jgi:hypothetical protein
VSHDRDAFQSDDDQTGWRLASRLRRGTLMALRDHAQSEPVHRSARSHRSIEYRVLYALGFAVFFLIAVVRRVLPIDRLFRGVPRRKVSIVHEAREATGATIPYVFMG